MAKLSKSPQRYTFQKERYLKRRADEGKTPENDEDVKAMADYYDSWLIESDNKELDPNWAENNMEYDLRTTGWILEKVRSSNSYAQNLYAAMCNNDFLKNEFMPRLSGKTWSCSWRYAGGIIADMQGHGDYINWYCSGIRGGHLDAEEDDIKEHDLGFVAESVVTDEIRADLRKLGWEVIEYSGEE